MIILWIDPWTTTVWYSLIEADSTGIKIIDFWGKSSVEQPLKTIKLHTLPTKQYSFKRATITKEKES